MTTDNDPWPYTSGTTFPPVLRLEKVRDRVSPTSKVHSHSLSSHAVKMALITERARRIITDRCAAWGIPVYDTPVVERNTAMVSAQVFKRAQVFDQGFADDFIAEHLAAHVLFTILATAPSAAHLREDWITSTPDTESPTSTYYACTIHLFEPADKQWQEFWMNDLPPGASHTLANVDALVASWRVKRRAFLNLVVTPDE